MSPCTNDFEHGVFGDCDARLEDAERTGAAVSVLHPAKHRRCRCDKAPEAGEDPGLKIRRVHRRPLGRTDQFDQARQRANRGVRGLEFRIRPFTAEPADIEMNEAGIFLPERGKIQCRTIRRVDIAAVDQDIAMADQLRQARRSAGIMGIEHDARLVEVQEREPCAPAFRRQRRGAAKRITLRRFDLLNGRPEVREQPGAVARRRSTSDLDNYKMRQRLHHASSLPK